MPFMSYASEEQTLENAASLMRAGANCVKLEGTAWISKSTELLAERGIPVCAHMGLTPQSVNRIGGYIVQGRDPNKAEELIQEAKLLENSGASMLLLECVPRELAKSISESLAIPVIGIGAGPDVDGQIMVIYDLIGITQMEKAPKFVKNFLLEANSIENAIEGYVKEVKEKTFPSAEHSFE
jgi:3-methyl-2-oxobutanoate hydroxymethyltransferase